MVSLTHLKKYFSGKSVFVTGHTGFKGAWLTIILKELGAHVHGYALAPTTPFYHELNADHLCASSTIADLLDQAQLTSKILEVQPDYVFHLAAQPLVLEGYQNPLYTFQVNGIGTAHVLEALKALEKKCVAILITTDKVYDNPEDNHPFIESDPLGGHDPYSASKAVAEIIIASYTKSFFSINEIEKHGKAIASVRAGNVIGGGDYAPNRIIPDIIRALEQNQELEVRYPDAVRPWQYVLEPLGGYLLLATKLIDDPKVFSGAYNFGPEEEDFASVRSLVEIALRTAKRGSWKEVPPQLHESKYLRLSINKAKEKLGWHPQWNAEQAITKSIEWYLDDDSAINKCLKHIHEYFTI